MVAFIIPFLFVGVYYRVLQVNAFVHTSKVPTPKHMTPHRSRDVSGDEQEKSRPKLIVFDLDGCLWRPEMYELIHFMGNKGAPFRPSEHDRNTLLSVGDEPIELLRDVREVMRELHRDPQWRDVSVGISSRTDAPHWARELLTKFTIQDSEGEFAMVDVFQGPIEMSYDSKVKHFDRISHRTKIGFQDMVFFDNEFGNCASVADLGVTVGYCPGGVCKGIWEKTLDAFSSSRQGTVVELKM